MDDLSGLDWSAASSSTPAPRRPNPQIPTNALNPPLNLKPSPVAGRAASPAAGSTLQNGAGKPSSAKAGDSFSNLVAFGKSKQDGNLSLVEKQRRLEEQRRRDAEEKQKKMDALFGAQNQANAGFWDSLGGAGAGGFETAQSPPADDADDLLAAFSSAAPVDRTSHFPPPSSASNGASPSPFEDLLGDGTIPAPTPPPRKPLPRKASPLQELEPEPMNEMDLFATENLPSNDRSPYPDKQSTTPQQDDDFDILGDLAKPVSEFAQRPPAPAPARPKPAEHRSPSSPPSADPRDGAIAEIVSMGFTAEQAKKALAETETGLDVERAVGWLLDEAHRKSKAAKSTPSRSDPHREERSHSRSREDASRVRDAGAPAWARGGQDKGGEKDLGKYAAEVGGSLFKSANSLWNAGKKKVERAVSEFQAEDSGDPNVPKWMRERQTQEQPEACGNSRHNKPSPDEKFSSDKSEPGSSLAMTDEAMLLEIGGGPPSRRKTQEQRASSSRGQSPAVSARERAQLERQRAFEAAVRQKEQEMRERQERARAASTIPDSSTRKARLAADPEPEVYVSRNRRRPPPAASSKPTPPPKPDLLNGNSGGGSSRNPFAADVAAQLSRPPKPQAPPVPPPRRSAPQRPHISLSPSALATSNASRQKGTEAFKRGDYSAAQAHYSSSLTPVPEGHMLRVILLANRSLCTVKLGDPKAALTDVEGILTLIGDSRGQGETIPLDGAQKDMKDYWTKAIVRKAECLEQLEKFAEAKAAWELALAERVPNASNGKQRCEKALRPKPAPKPAARPPQRPKPASKPSVEAQKAVRALREQNASQDRVEAEKLELYDVVEARVNAWKAGKEGNLRALLAGLDTVLWESSGWKKISMADLLVAQKVKIQYMKGIAKVHPDKIKSDATTEQRMISAAVFSLLNDSWDKFKAENGL